MTRLKYMSALYLIFSFLFRISYLWMDDGSSNYKALLILSQSLNMASSKSKHVAMLS